MDPRYTTDLQKRGVECIHAPFYVSVQDFLQKRGHEFDLVFITRYDVAERHIDQVRQHSKAKVLFNNADLHFLRELRSHLSKGHTDLSGPLATRDRELAVMRKVDAILTYNETEQVVIASHNLRNDNIFKCPWVLPAHGHQTPFEKREGIAFLGGYRHHPNVEAVEFFVEKVMPLLRAKGKASSSTSSAATRLRNSNSTNRTTSSSPAEEMSLVKGYFEAHREGYGFVIPDVPGKRDIFIPARATLGAMDNERVVARIESTVKRDGRIIRVLARGHARVAGTFEADRTGYYVKPWKKSVPFDLYIAPGDRGQAKDGNRVIAEIISYPTDTRQPAARIVKVLDKPANPNG